MTGPSESGEAIRILLEVTLIGPSELAEPIRVIPVEFLTGSGGENFFPLGRQAQN